MKLRRWEIFGAQDIGSRNDPYLDRLRLLRTPLFSVYLHHIHRGETSRAGHDHPWAFWSLVLSGAYEEVVYPDKHDPDACVLRRHNQWSVHRMPLGSAHCVRIVHGLLWTLVVTGPEVNAWGFYPGGRFVPWKEYEDAEPVPE